MYYSNSERYEGEWFENKRDGKGIIRKYKIGMQSYRDGSKYEGDWLEDKKDGKGFVF